MTVDLLAIGKFMSVSPPNLIPLKSYLLRLVLWVGIPVLVGLVVSRSSLANLSSIAYAVAMAGLFVTTVSFIENRRKNAAYEQRQREKNAAKSE